MENSKNHRWFIVVLATFTHLLLGTVYAWSFFQKPISETYGWSQSETAWTFSVAIFMLGITAAWCGGKIEKFGVKKLAVTGTILYALGYIISYFALKYHVLPLLYFGFGVVGGIGLGMAYVTPVAAVSGWFPDKQGLATGMVVMGFGLGAFVMSKILAPVFLKIFDGNLANVFLSIGILLLLIHPLAAFFLKANPTDKNHADTEKLNISRHIFNPDYIFIWLIFTFNIVAGMIFISFQSPLLQDLLKKEGVTETLTLEQKGATLIGISALFNGIGRFFWGSISDKVGRLLTFSVLLIVQIFVFLLLIFTSNSLIFSLGVCLVLMCYGGGFGVLPSLIKEKYGSKLMASLYGLTLTGWGVGGIFGPQLIAFLKDHFSEKASQYAFVTELTLLLLGLIMSVILRRNQAVSK